MLAANRREPQSRKLYIREERATKDGPSCAAAWCYPVGRAGPSDERVRSGASGRSGAGGRPCACASGAAGRCPSRVGRWLSFCSIAVTTRVPTLISSTFMAGLDLALTLRIHRRPRSSGSRCDRHSKPHTYAERELRATLVFTCGLGEIRCPEELPVPRHSDVRRQLAPELIAEAQARLP